MSQQAGGDDKTNLKNALITVSDGVIGAGILVFVGVLLGNWADDKLHSAPLCVIIFALVGGGLGLARLVMKAVKIGETADKTSSGNTKNNINEKDDSLPPQS